MNLSITSLVLLFMVNSPLFAQLSTISGIVTNNREPVEFANIYLEEAKKGTTTDEAGAFFINRIRPGEYTLRVSYIGYKTYNTNITVKYGQDLNLDISLEPDDVQGEEVVITGTLKEISRAKSPVPVEVFTPKYFKMNPTPSLYDAMQSVNGVRPQLNCNVCNTGDIHINGLEGPYTMILIDGMPIVSGLSTVYGLSGIPNSIVERIEIVKGPASTLYGSEAVGGLINVITKKPSNASIFTIDMMSSSWGEVNTDVAGMFNVGSSASELTGVNAFWYDNAIDNNGDNFTDVTLQKRVSVFQKWAFKRPENKLFTLAGRFLYEDRWGGEMDWTYADRGGDEVYGESIFTQRWEMIGNYQLPTFEKLLLSFSFNAHHQDSYYGDTFYLADQRIGFAQLTWDKEVGNHSFVVGSALRYTWYDDNTPATTAADEILLPGIFVQDDITLTPKTNLLLGLRYDYNSSHRNIWTPRFAWKWSVNEKNIIRLNAGTGFRVVNLFTEEHAALTGSREVVIVEELEPEQSYNANVNYEKKFFGISGAYLGLDATAWYTYFNNQISPDYETNPNQIIYDNLDGYAVTRGFSLNADLEFDNGIKIKAGGSFIDVFMAGEDEFGDETKTRPVLTEKWTGTWSASFPLRAYGLKIDYTGNLYGPMKLPVLGEADPRAVESPWWSLQNIQLTWSQPNNKFEIYGGVKNLLNYTPPANSIARSSDPFDRNVVFDGNGNPEASANNPYALTFDPAYVYAPNQGIRGFLGFRYLFR